MLEKLIEWFNSESGCWFFIGFFLCDFFNEVTKGNSFGATISLAIVLANVWLLKQK